VLEIASSQNLNESIEDFMVSIREVESSL